MIGILAEIKVKDKNFKNDAKEVDFPYDLVDALVGVVDEITFKKFKYIKISSERSVIVVYGKPKEKILIEVIKEGLLIRHFDVFKDRRKLKVLYVVKPHERIFKLL